MADPIGTTDLLASALARLDVALADANVGHLIQKADRPEIDDAFSELRSHGLEPSKRLGELYALGNPVDVTIDPWIYGKLEMIPVRFLAEGHESVALGSNRRLRADWRGHWIVIGRAGDDPYVVDASKPEMPVFTDTHGVGAWQPQLVASTLAGFLNACASWVERFVGPGIDPEPESYRENRDDRGERGSRAAWRAFTAELERDDPAAAADAFWPRRGTQ